MLWACGPAPWCFGIPQSPGLRVPLVVRRVSAFSRVRLSLFRLSASSLVGLPTSLPFGLSASLRLFRSLSAAQTRGSFAWPGSIGIEWRCQDLKMSALAFGPGGQWIGIPGFRKTAVLAMTVIRSYFPIPHAPQCGNRLARNEKKRTPMRSESFSIICVSARSWRD